jgi:predicted permease
MSSAVWEGLGRDVFHAVRSLTRAPVFAAIAIGTLGLAIGTTAAVFSIVNGLLLRPLPVAHPEALVTISSESATRLGFTTGLGWAYAMWSRLQQRAQPFAGALAVSPQRLNLARTGEVQPADVLFVSGDFFATLGITAAVGRPLTAADDVRGGGPAGPVAVISDRLWRQRFDRANVIGATLRIEGVPFTIVGVTPPQFYGLEVGRVFDVAVPLGTEPLIHPQRPSLDAPNQFFLTTIMLRLRPGQSLPAATATTRGLQPEILGPDRMPGFVKEPFILVPAASGTSGAQIGGRGIRQQYTQPVLVMLAIVGLVLLIACVSLAGLLIERASARRQELSMRMALGGSRWRLARQLLVESLVLAVAGAAVGLLFAAWSSRLLVSQLSGVTGAIVLNLSADWRVLGFSTAVTLLTAALVGSAPAFRSTRAATRDAVHSLRGGLQTRVSHGAGSAAAQSGTLVVQVALSVVLVIAAALLTRSFQRLSSRPVGFNSRGLVLITVHPGRTDSAPESRLLLYQRSVDAVTGLGGVARASGSIFTPVEGGGQAFSVEVPGGAGERRVLRNAVMPGWFATYDTPILEGRDFDATDNADGEPVMIVNSTFARMFAPGQSPIGRVFAGRRVVAIAGNQVIHGGFKENGQPRSLRDDAPPTVYLPLSQPERLRPPDAADLIVTARLLPGSTPPSGAALAAALGSIDPAASFRMALLSDRLDAALAGDRMVAVLAGFFGAVVFLLAGLGLYGVTSCVVAQRRNELGIRLALGARPSSLVGLVLRRSLIVSTLGIALGIAAALAVTRYLDAFLFGLTPLDATTFLGVALMFVAITTASAVVPAARAARLDPSAVLRP